MRRSPMALTVIMVALAVAGGCDRDTPTTPTQNPYPISPVAPPPALTGLLFSSLPSLLVVGTSLPLRASGRYSDGSVQAVEPQWAVTPSAAAEISSSGVLTTRSPANVTVTARFEGFEAQAGSTLVADHSGTWRGTWNRLECFGRRCGLGDFANPIVDLLITQNGRVLSSVMLFGPWDATRYTLSGRGLAGSGPSSLGLFWLERAPNGERLFEITTPSSQVTLSAIPTLSARISMRFTEGEEMTRLEFTLDNLVLVSRAVRIPE